MTMINSFSHAVDVKLDLQRVNSEASHHHNHHKPQVRISLHPDSLHTVLWCSGPRTTEPDGGLVIATISGPAVSLDSAAFIAVPSDPGSELGRRSRLRTALMTMIADTDVDLATKLAVVDQIIAKTEDLVKGLGGVPEARVTALVTVGTLRGVPASDDEDEEGDEDVEWMAPAAEAAIEALQRLRIDDDDDVEERECVICLEGFERESELCRLGCSHVFHGGCLRTWLKKSHYCPLCRFQLPTQSSD